LSIELIYLYFDCTTKSLYFWICGSAFQQNSTSVSMGKLHFSGHESFICKQFWLKKGVDFIQSGQSFSADDAVVGLGVGKNMVRSIKYWLKAFNIIELDKDVLTEEGEQIFVSKTGDPYLESIGTIWLLHYLLVKTEHASLYNLVFNDFRRLRPEFKAEQLASYISRYCSENDLSSYNENTVGRDIRVLLNNYLPPSINKKSDIEDSFAGLLFELRLIEIKNKLDVVQEQQVSYYAIEPGYRESLPTQIVLYTILDYIEEGRTVTFQDLYNGHNSPGSVFALSQEGLYQKIQEIIRDYPDISYSETAGNRILQIPASFNSKSEILYAYYN